MTNDNLNNTVLFANDGSESLSQFVGDRIIGQLANNLGNMALAFPSVANSVLFANGATTASTAAAQQLTQMTASALGLTAFTLGNELQLLPGGTTLIPALQNAIFGTVNGITGTTSGTTTGTTGTSSTTSTSLFNALQALPTTSTAFASAFPGVFSTALTNVTSILSPFVGTFPTPTLAPNTNPVTGALSPTFTANTFKSGFLGGFGTGATGFGVAPAAANTDFGAGFNNFVSTTNPAMGFFTPPITTGSGVVGTIGVTTGPGNTGTGTTGTTGSGTTGSGTTGSGTTGSGTTGTGTTGTGTSGTSGTTG